MKKKKKIIKSVAICLAHNYENFSKDFAMNLMRIQYYFLEWAQQPSNVEWKMSVLIQGGYQLDWMRSKVTEKALEMGHDYLLFLDTDMTFSDDVIPKMLLDLMANPEYNAVSGIYFKSKPPHLPLIYAPFCKKTKSFIGIGGMFPLDQPFEIGGCGGGCLMVKKELFKNKKPPYFRFIYKDTDKKIPFGLGEDLYFCWKMKPKLLCEPRIECGHQRKTYTTLKTYLKHNKLKVKNNKISMTTKKLQSIRDEQDKEDSESIV